MLNILITDLIFVFLGTCGVWVNKYNVLWAKFLFNIIKKNVELFK